MEGIGRLFIFVWQMQELVKYIGTGFVILIGIYLMVYLNYRALQLAKGESIKTSFGYTPHDHWAFRLGGMALFLTELVIIGLLVVSL